MTRQATNELEAVAWAIMRALHSNVPEADRPQSWSDLDQAQEQRLRTAAAAAIELVRKPVPRPPSLLTELRSAGWFVGVHNDYVLDGIRKTFWLLTHPTGLYVKGEGDTDMEALRMCAEQAKLWAEPAMEVIEERCKR